MGGMGLFVFPNVPPFNKGKKKKLHLRRYLVNTLKKKYLPPKKKFKSLSFGPKELI